MFSVNVLFLQKFCKDTNLFFSRAFMKLKVINDLLGIFFPKSCCCCGSVLLTSENQICTECLLGLPFTDYSKVVENPVEKIFWGRVPIEAATALLSFSKKGGVQRILHSIKYKDNKELGVYMGRQLGLAISESHRFDTVDYIVPVPLHPKKLKKRGYNQSEEIAKGIIAHLHKPLCTDVLIRTRFTETQTKKGRFSRWENVSDKFALFDTGVFENKHILIVDDVITTGATIESCARAVLEAPGAKVSVAGLAFAGH